MAESTGEDDYQMALIDQFIAVTGVSRERASFFLQSAAWNLQTAMDSFYDVSGHEAVEENLPVEETRPPSPGPSVAGTIHPLASKPTGKSSGAGVATLSDYRDKPEASGKDAQQFYAGGSEHSGQMIEGPPKKKTNPQDIAKNVFEAAKKQGAVDVEEENRKKEQERSAAFQGSGFRLGDSEGPSTVVRGSQRQTRPTERVHNTLTFWKDGFSVDDGPLRTGESEEDRKFIESVSKGEIPHELRSAARGGEVDIDIQDKRTECYTKPRPKLIAFSGEGHKLGSYAPEVVSHSSPTTAPAGGVTGTSVDPPTVPLDSSQPTTSVQIRLADGSRLVTKFNHTHTVNDIRQFINLSKPSMSSANYVLMTTFPNRELSDPTLTLSQANLLNAVIVQRMK